METDRTQNDKRKRNKTKPACAKLLCKTPVSPTTPSYILPPHSIYRISAKLRLRTRDGPAGIGTHAPSAVQMPARV